jgi:non-heme chloroperoxidase
MFWGNSIGQLARASRRRIYATAIMYAISATFRFYSAAGEETKIPAYSAVRNGPMTSLTSKDGMCTTEPDVIDADSFSFSTA